MDAREYLIEVLYGVKPSPVEGVSREEVANEVINEHSRELAEKILKHAQTLNDPHGRYRSYMDCAKLFADLISPTE